MIDSGHIGSLADITQILEHAAGIGEGRVFGDRLMREPVGNVLCQGNGATADEQNTIQFYTQAKLTTGLCMELLDDLALAGLNQGRHIMIFALPLRIFVGILGTMLTFPFLTVILKQLILFTEKCSDAMIYHMSAGGTI